VGLSGLLDATASGAIASLTSVPYGLMSCGTRMLWRRLRAPAHRCTLPLKALNVGTIRMRAVLALADRRHVPHVREAIAILNGTHPAWRALWGTRGDSRARSALTPEQVADLLRWGAIRRATQRGNYCQRVFVTPKSDGRSGRPIYDARAQNAHINWATLRTGFRLLQPLAHVRVGLAVGATRPALFEADATSYFPSFRWCRRLQRHHGFEVRGVPYEQVAPAQGSALMPLVAQVTSAAIARAPPPQAPDAAWVAAGLSIVYDNFLLSGDVEDVAARAADLAARARHAGVVLGTDTGVTTRLVSCGLEFDVAPRRWRLKPAWAERAADTLNRAPTSVREWQVAAGLAVWACRATLRPLAAVHNVLRPILGQSARPSEALRELRALRAVVHANEWRTLLDHGVPLRAPPDTAIVVYSDASLTGAGAVIAGGAHRAWRWPAPRPASQQQLCEAEAATLALEFVERVDAVVVLVLDNEGVAGWLLSGNPAAQRAVPLLERMRATLAHRRQRLWVALVPSADMLADGLSRGDTHPPAPASPQALAQLRRGATEVAWAAACPAHSPCVDLSKETGRVGGT
jgi:hypothetical protein